MDLLLVCLALKCELTRSFFLLRLPNSFAVCLDSDKKILHLRSKHVIAMSSRKGIRRNITSLCFQKFV